MALSLGVSTSCSTIHGRSYCLWFHLFFIVVSYSTFGALYLILMSLARIIYVFYRHNRDTNKFLQSNGSINRRHYLRILALACIDILLTLPLGIITITIFLLNNTRSLIPGFTFRFYYGWEFVHSNWSPVALPYSAQLGAGFWTSVKFYLGFWTSPILAIAIFSLFGLTSEACATYWRGFCSVAKLFGWTPPAPKHADLGEIEFGARQLSMIDQCVLRPLTSYLPAYLPLL
jgi:hypothetical protein